MGLDEVLVLWGARFLAVGLTVVFVHLLLVIVREFRGAREKVRDE
jgi:hypothetical protein